MSQITQKVVSDSEGHHGIMSIKTRLAGVLSFTTLTMGICASAAPAGGAADEFPTQSIRIVVPFPPGGSTDAIARLLADGLSKELGTQVYIDNRPGGATNIGSENVAKSRADGYTLLFGGSGLVMNSVFGPKPSFDSREMLEPVSTVAEVPLLLATNPATPFSTAAEFFGLSRSDPGKYTLASAQLDIFVATFRYAANVDVLHVPYKGGAQAVTDVMSGQVDTVFALVPVLLPHIQTGKLQAIGISSSKRLVATLPDVPTFSEVGVDFVTTVWYGLQLPAGVPEDRRARLNSAARKAVDSPEFGRRLAEIGARASSSTPEDMQRLLAQQRLGWETLATKHPDLLQGVR